MAAFLIDENLPGQLVLDLQRAGHGAMAVRTVGLMGRPDSEVFIHAREHNLTVLTSDTDFGDRRAFPPPHAGIVIVRIPKSVTIVRRRELIVAGVTAVPDGVLANRVFRLDTGGVHSQDT